MNEWRVFRFGPGLKLDKTANQATGYFIELNRVRFDESGNLTPIRGWETFYGGVQVFTAPVRGSVGWSLLAGDKVFAAGSATALEFGLGGQKSVITPLKRNTSEPSKVSAVNGSSVFTLSVPTHGLRDGDQATIARASTVAGQDINGTHTVTVKGLNQFTIDLGAGNEANADASNAGGTLDLTVPLDAGNVDGTGGSGFGTGLFGLNPYGQVTTGGDVFPRTWSLAPWGEALLANPSKGGLYFFHPAFSYDEILTSGDFAASTGWTTGTNWSIGSGVATATGVTADQKLEQDVEGILSGGRIYTLVLDVTVTSGAVQFGIERFGDPENVDEDIGEPISETGVYTRNFYAPPSPLKVFLKGGAANFTGSVASISTKPTDEAVRINSAPPHANTMAVTDNGFCVLGGTVTAAGKYDPKVWRWCEPRNINQWLPIVDGVATGAGETEAVAEGSFIVGSIRSANGLYGWTDTAFGALAYVGGSEVFNWRTIGTENGLIGPMAAASVGGRIFWMGQKKFYAFNAGDYAVNQSGSVIELYCPILQDVLDNLVASQDYKIWCAPNPQYSEVLWGVTDKRIDPDGEVGRIIAFNYVGHPEFAPRGFWMRHDIARTDWIASGASTFPVAFGTDGTAYVHERGSTADGDPLNWMARTADFDVSDGAQHIDIQGYMPDWDDLQGEVQFKMYGRLWPHRDAVARTPRPFNADTRKLTFAKVKARSVSVEWSSTSIETGGRMGVARFHVKPSKGKR